VSELAIAILGGVGAMLGWGIADFFGKVSVDAVGELPSLVWGHAVGTGFLGIGVLANVGTTATNHKGLSDAATAVAVALFGVLQAVVYFLLYKGFAHGQIAVLSPTFACFSGIVALLSITALGERATTLEVLALLGIFAGVLLLSSAPSDGEPIRMFGTPGFAPVALATLLAAGWTLGWGHLAIGHKPMILAWMMYGAMTAALLAMAKAQRVALKVSRRGWAPLACIGVGEAVAYGALTWAYSETSRLSIVALVSGAFSLPTIALARIFLREKLARAALGGAAVVIACTALLALSR
jgi:uncharacterized membrane protein